MEEKFLMVGEAAKKLGVSVRTLQYYDKIGLIHPASQSEGGRRLYSNKDIVKIYQVLSLKYLGFSLEEINNKLLNLDSPKEVIKALELQENNIKEQIKSLEEVQKSLGALKNEIKEINAVDWSKYAGIISMMSRQNENYWVVKHFEQETIENAAIKYDADSAQVFIKKLENLWDRVIALIDSGESESSEPAQIMAKEWWDMVTEFTGGDMNILQDLMKFASKAESWENKSWKDKMEKTQNFLSKALEVYFINNEMEAKQE